MYRLHPALLLVAASGFAGCRPVGAPAPPAARGLPTEEPVVRVGVLVAEPAVLLAAPEGFEVTVRGRTVTTATDGREWRATTLGERVSLRDPAGRVHGPFAAPVHVRPRGGSPLRIGEHAYRGGALLRPEGERLTAVNVLGLEDYLAGVVPHELGSRPPSEIEAVKAQAVAARTYAVSHLGRRDALGFDFHATVQDQVYRGLSVRDTVAERAVRETRGEIVAWEGRPILAYYSSTCGGRTSAIDEVWRSPPVPYLRSVADRDPGTGRDYCEISNRYRWTETWTGERLARILSATLAAHEGLRALRIERVEELRVSARTTSGRVDTLLVGAHGRSFRVHGDSTRWVLRPDSAQGRILNSAAFTLEAEHAEGGVARLVARGAGWGHGIGLCQMGAIGRARAGQDHRTILATYYQGTQVLRLY